MKVPTYKKYGLSRRKFDNIKFRSSRVSLLLSHEIPLVIGVILGIVFWIISFKKLNPSGFIETAGQIFLFGTMGMVCVGIPMLIFKGVERLYYAYLGSRSEAYKSAVKYETDREQFDYWKIRRDESYWKLLDGLSFENEVRSVFLRIGYEFKSEIPVAEAKKIFLIKNNGEEYLLICKTGKGQHFVSEYMKVLLSNSNAPSKIIIVSQDNFSNDIVNDAGGRPVKLVSVKELAELVRTINH